MIASNAAYASLRKDRKGGRSFLNQITSFLALDDHAEWFAWDETDTDTEASRLRQQQQHRSN